MLASGSVPPLATVGTREGESARESKGTGERRGSIESREEGVHTVEHTKRWVALHRSTEALESYSWALDHIAKSSL